MKDNKDYLVTVHCTMVEEDTVIVTASSEAEAKRKVANKLSDEGWAGVFADTSGDLVECESTVVDVEEVV